MDGVKCVIVIHEMGEIFMRVAIASDHGGYRLKERLKKYLKNQDSRKNLHYLFRNLYNLYPYFSNIFIILLS